MNAREGIKTPKLQSSPTRYMQLKTMNAREGIKTRPGNVYYLGMYEPSLAHPLSTRPLLKTMNARKGIKTKSGFNL